MKLFALAIGTAAGALVLAVLLALGSPSPAQADRIVVELGHGSMARDFAVHAGVPVTLTIVNRSGRAHSFDVPRLHINYPIALGTMKHPTSVTLHFMVPRQELIRWYCFMPCGHGMSGMIYAVSGLDFRPGGWHPAT